MDDMDKYGFDIHWSEEDNQFIAVCPSFPGLSTYGNTHEEALKQAKIVLPVFIEALKTNRMPIPEYVDINNLSIGLKNKNVLDDPMYRTIISVKTKLYEAYQHVLPKSDSISWNDICSILSDMEKFVISKYSRQ